jgi:hypothetical protein
MNLYEVDATRWYYSTIVYRTIAENEDDAWEKCERDAIGVLELSASSPDWNGEEEYHDVQMLETIHDIHVEDNVQNNHTNCQYLGNNRWNCGHIDLDNSIENMQLPLIEGYEASLDKPKSWIMWFEKWCDALDGDAYTEAWEQYQASGGNG